MRETTALGAALAAGLATGVWKSVDEIKAMKGATFTKFSGRRGKSNSWCSILP